MGKIKYELKVIIDGKGKGIYESESSSIPVIGQKFDLEVSRVYDGSRLSLENFIVTDVKRLVGLRIEKPESKSKLVDETFSVTIEPSPEFGKSKINGL